MDLLGRSKGKVCLAYWASLVILMQCVAVSLTSSADPSSGAVADVDHSKFARGPAISDSTLGDRLRRGDVEDAFQRLETRRSLELASSNPYASQLSVTQPMTLEDARRSLDAGTLLLSFAVEATEVHVFAITADDEQTVVKTLPIGAALLEKEAALLIESIFGARREGTVYFEQFEEYSKKLYDRLLLPLDGMISSSDRVVVVPDGILHRLPFASLTRHRADGTTHYVAEWKPFHKAMSVSSYGVLKTAGPVDIGDSSRMVIFGDADYDSVAGGVVGSRRANLSGGWPTLPGSGLEVRRVAPSFRSHRLFMGKSSTTENLRSLNGDIDILHLSVHGSLDSENPLRSALIFSPERRHGRALVASERLEVEEILSGDLPTARLVVLSACDSALGPRRRGLDGMGLGWAFLNSGARSVVSSLWQVDDQGTADLMQRFYAHMANGVPQSEALRLAQIDLMKTADTSAPYFWAAFQIEGHWR